MSIKHKKTKTQLVRLGMTTLHGSQPARLACSSNLVEGKESRLRICCQNNQGPSHVARPVGSRSILEPRHFPTLIKSVRQPSRLWGFKNHHSCPSPPALLYFPNPFPNGRRKTQLHPQAHHSRLVGVVFNVRTPVYYSSTVNTYCQHIQECGRRRDYSRDPNPTYQGLQGRI